MKPNITLPIILAINLIFLPIAYAEPTVAIIIEKTTYSYCEKLFYTIKVSEVTGEPAIINIRDESGKSSSDIPIPITDLQTPVPSRIAFQEEIFPLGKYFIDVQYSGKETTAEFDLVDSNNVCIPEKIKPILSNWISGKISDGFLIDTIQEYVDAEIIDIPFEINNDTIFKIDVPDWVKNVGYWFIEGSISDEDFIQVMNYLIDKKIISLPTGSENEI